MLRKLFYLFLFVSAAGAGFAVDLERHFQGVLAIPFGDERANPFTGERTYTDHAFITLRYGAPIPALHPGVVEKTGSFSEYLGMTVMVNHGKDKYLVYGCLSRTDVKPGDEVTKNMIIGAAGGGGDRCGMQGPGVALYYISLSKLINPASL